VESASDKEEGEPGSPCALRLRTCFSESFLDVRSSTAATSTTETFRRIAFEHPRCGDCLIVHLLAKTGNVGLEVFLPSRATAEVTREDEIAIETIGGNGKEWENVEYEHWTGSDASIRSRVSPPFLSIRHSAKAVYYRRPLLSFNASRIPSRPRG